MSELDGGRVGVAGLIMASACLLALPGCTPAEPEAPPFPNIVYMLADDLG